jgi:membrane associated rhomboid family serine protease
MIPVGTGIRTRRVPVMTVLILVAMFAVWTVVQGGYDQVVIFLHGGGWHGNDLQVAATVCNLGMVPGEITHLARLGSSIPIGPGVSCVIDNDAINYLTPLLSMFLHGSWGHILGNALFFWVFGAAVEDVMGSARFLAFYLICGLVAAAAQIAATPASPIPTVGASGAISGVMGAFLVLYPAVRVRMLFIFIIFFKVFAIPAWIVLLWWFAIQLISGLPTVLSPSPEVAGGVAFWAHVGGFLAGAVLVRWFARPELLAPGRRLRGPFAAP